MVIKVALGVALAALSVRELVRFWQEGRAADRERWNAALAERLEVDWRAAENGVSPRARPLPPRPEGSPVKIVRRGG